MPIPEACSFLLLSLKVVKMLITQGQWIYKWRMVSRMFMVSIPDNECPCLLQMVQVLMVDNPRCLSLSWTLPGRSYILPTWEEVRKSDMEWDDKYADVSQLQVDNGDIYILTQTVSNDYPVTNSSTITDDNRTIAITKLSFCSGYTPPPLTVSPATQTVCQFGLATQRSKRLGNCRAGWRPAHSIPQWSNKRTGWNSSKIPMAIGG
jgi:hypothetical protein